MSKLTDAADAVRRAAQMYENFVTAAAVLDRLGSIEQAEREAQDAVDKANRERLSAEAALKTAQDAATEQEAANAAAVQKAHDDAAAIVSKADEYARQSKADAEAQASEILKAADRSAEEVRSAGEAAKRLFESNRDAVKAELFDMEAKRDAAAEELAEVEGKLKAAEAARRAALA